MPDVTVSFTDEQWTRIVAASSAIIFPANQTVDVTNLAAKWKTEVTNSVKAYEHQNASIDDF
jgi:hypothetical protein